MSNTQQIEQRIRMNASFLQTEVIHSLGLYDKTKFKQELKRVIKDLNEISEEV